MKWVTFIVCLLALANAQTEPATIRRAMKPLAVGKAYHYQPGKFREVAANPRRNMVLRSDVIGYASVRDCRHIGDLVLAAVGDTFGWFQIVDCTDPKDNDLQDQLELIIEVNYDIALAGGWEWNEDTQTGSGKTSAAIYMYREEP